MYKQNAWQSTTMKINTSYKGERIEEKIQRIVNNKEPISDGAPIIYTERKDGVRPEYNIKTDRWEVAIDAMDAVSKSYTARREMSMGERAFTNMTEEQKTEFNTKYPMNKHNKKDSGAEPIQGK